VCRSDTATFSVSLHGNTWDIIGTAFVEGRTIADTLHRVEIASPIGFRYVKVEIPKCFNDYSSVEVNW
jgi:hypothetical protein